MRFQQLKIPAFGPFTNLELNFPSDPNDLHVIYGENEAGKSSLLRAIRDLLFGIHGQSSDNFLHDYKNLRLVGDIVNRAGDQLIFQRRKGNKNTLLDQSGNSLPDTALLPFLAGIDLGYFSAMFGLGTTELREGAKELLQGEGDIGKALFSASMGGTPIQHALNALTEESEKFFKGRATANVSIRPGANHYKELLRSSRDSMVNPDTWDKLEKEISEAEQAKQKLESELSKIDADLSWISRCEDALPSVGHLREELNSLAELPALPDVASDFVERARSARNALNETSGKVKMLEARIGQLKKQQDACKMSPEILADSDALDLLHQDLGAYRTRKENHADLQIKLAAIEPNLKSGMQAVELTGELETLETLRINSSLRLQCEEAAKALGDVIREKEEKQNQKENLRKDVESLENDVKALSETDLSPLREALAVAATATEADRTLTASETQVKSLLRKVGDEHAQVIGVPKDLDATAGLVVPAQSTIRTFRNRFDKLDRDINGAEDEIAEKEKSLESLRDELNRLERRGVLPGEQSLRDAREHRDHGWELVLADWKGDGAKEELDPDTPLEAAFPKAIDDADDIADQLRLDAEAVAQAEEKRFQIQKTQGQLEKANDKQTSMQTELADCKKEWDAEWAECGIQPRSPHEMEEWRDSWIQFRETLTDLRDAKTTVRSKSEQILKAKEQLAAALDDSPEKKFPVLFEAVRKNVQDGEELTGRRNQLVDQLKEQRKKLEDLDQDNSGHTEAADTAEEDWQSICIEIGLPTDVSPETGLALLQERKELLAKYDTWKELSTGAQNIEVALDEYDKAVSEKASAFGAEANSTETQEASLWETLSKTRKVQTRRDQLAEQIEDANQELSEATQLETQAKEDLKEIMGLANLKSTDELEPILANLEKRDKFQERISSYRDILSGLARDVTVDDFIDSVQTENADELPSRKGRLDRENSEKKSELGTIHETLLGLKKQMEDLENAGDAAAGFRQQAESVAASLKQDASRYMRLRLAVHFLKSQIERFREENQGPLLEKSGQVFQAITRGNFEGLAAEFNEQDIPILVGRRGDGSMVTIEGMSDGSRDQLYLSLRLAALDRYLEEHEPMPLILDDLLITFDNERAKAILAQLADLARRTQILLFTHHEHLVELCRQILAKDQFNLHQLNDPSLVTAE